MIMQFAVAVIKPDETVVPKHVSRASSEEPSIKDALNKPQTPGRDERQQEFVRWFTHPLVSVINSYTHSAPPPFCLSTVYS